MIKNDKKHDYWLGALKGWAIILVVLGHAGIGEIVRVIYSFHMALFFFIAGYSYHFEKYARNPYALLSARLKTSLLPYFLYNSFFASFQNVFLWMGVLTVEQVGAFITPSVLASNIGNIFTFHYTFLLCGASWFIPMWLCGVFVFGLLIALCVSFFSLLRTVESFRDILIPAALVCTVGGGVGCYMVSREIFSCFHLQTALLMLPIVFLGVLYQDWRSRSPFTAKRLLLNAALALVTLAAMIARWSFSPSTIIDISQNRIYSPFTFYAASLTGIVFSVCLMNLVQNVSSLKKMFNFVGRFSFDIMATHFVYFKLTDYFAFLLVPSLNEHYNLGQFCNSLGSIGYMTIVYGLVGVACPIIVRIVINRTFKALRSLIVRFQSCNSLEPDT